MRSSLHNVAVVMVAVVGCSAPVPVENDAAVDAPTDAASIDAPVDARIIDARIIDAAPLANPGFPTPTATTKANSFVGGAWTELGPADWTCLNTPSADQPSTQNLALSGKVRDFQTSSNGVGAATITAFPGVMTAGSLGTATSDAAAATKGNYAMTVMRLPAGQTRVGFKLEAQGYMRTYVLNQYLDPAAATQTRDLSAVSVGTTNAIIAFVGEQFDGTTGTVVGSVRDCQGRAVSNAVATVSSIAGVAQHLAGANTFYFSAAASSLPVRHNVSPTLNKDGLFMVIDVAAQPTPAFIQVWGFRTQAELTAGTLTLLSETATPVEGMAITSGAYEPRRQ